MRLGHLITKPKVLFKTYSHIHKEGKKKKKEEKHLSQSATGPSSFQGVLNDSSRIPRRSSNDHAFRSPLLHAFHSVLTERPCETFKMYFKNYVSGKKITGEILENW